MIADMRPLPRLRPQRTSGFSLIEVLTALMILSVGALGIAAMTAVSLKSKNTAYSRTQANILAYTMLDRLRANRAMALQHRYDIALHAAPPAAPPDGCLGTAADCSPADIVDLDLAQWKDSLAKLLPAGDGSIHTVEFKQMVQVTVSVRWGEQHAEQAVNTGARTEAPAAATLSVVVTSVL